ncbi:hypothetical protein ACFSUS_06685 [Spirosoma soli]|uniref:Uncharacterized protein n=1 Tax=Spirosoma soli TaxID=1770529 RepID=A0ABW5M2E8_9BACT
MKAKAIRFFSIKENSEPKEKSPSEPVAITGYISTSGKLVFPIKSVAQLSFDPESTRFKIGVQEGKRKVKSLFLIPTTNDDQSEAFEMLKAAKSYTIPLSFILKKSGIEYDNMKYTFTIKPFEYDGDVTGYELLLDDQAPKAEYTGKPRGRKRKADDTVA